MEGLRSQRLGRRALSVLRFAVLASAPVLAAVDAGDISQRGLERWGPEVGLAGSWVTDIAQDQEGFLWVATSGGLSRFDGHVFRNFTAATEAELPSSALGAMTVGPDGRIWVGLEQGGVRVLGDGALRRSPWVEPLPQVAVRSLVVDREGTLWIGTDQGIWRSGPRGAVRVPLSEEAKTARIQMMVLARDGAVWVRTRDHGIWRIDRTAVASIPDVPGCIGLGLAFAPDGGPVTSCVDGIWERRPAGADWTLVSPAGRVERLLVDRQGALWFGSTAGLVRRLPDGRTELLAVEGGLGDFRIRALFEDSRGEIWTGTFSGGLARSRRGAVLAVGAMQGLLASGTTGVAADSRGDLWIGTANHGLFRWGPDRGLLGRWTAATGLPCDRVWTVAVDREKPDRVWLGTPYGIVTLEGNVVRRVDRPGGRSEEEVTILYADPVAVGTVWAGGPAGGADELRAGKVVRHDDGNGLRVGKVRVFHRDRSGALLAAGERGAFRFDGARWHEVSLAGAEGTAVDALAEQPDGTLWIASTRAGLLRWSGGSLLKLGEREGIPFSSIQSLELDRLGGLWLSGNEGLLRLRLDDVDRWARGELKTVPTMELSARDGLRARECNGWGRPASCPLPGGKIAFPTIDGVALADPARLPRAELSPAELYIDRAWTGGRGIAPDGPIRLEPGERDLRVRFGAVEFDVPESTRFRYRLDGLDHHWVVAGSEREAAYSHVPPGRYLFRMQARLPGQEWVEAEHGPAVEVVPTLAESTWFRSLAGTFLLAIPLAFVGWRFRVQRAHAAELAVGREELRRLASALLRAQEEERARLAREIHDDVTQRLAGLAMLTGGYSQAVRRGPVPDLAASLEEVGRELEKLAADSQSLSRELHPSLLENVGLEGALRSECSTFAARTGLRVDYESRQVPADLAPEVGIVLYRIAQEALRNVVSHSGSREARVTLAGDSGSLELSVADSGSGFDAASRRPGSGLGLTSMAERARLVGAELTIESEPGTGTRVRVRAPRP